MGNPIDEKEKERIWATMAEFFVDNEIDYDYHAAKICAYPLQDLKEIFFREVAPVCGPNILTPIPPVWLSFDDEWVVREVKELLSKCRKSPLFRIRHELNVLYFRATLRHIWPEVEQAIKRQKDSGKRD
ncbi:hypothetical protein FAZ69_06785 [Trinickia terrae]|uniref:DUF7079 domain-containing protein n=1 Tax=Trinickia terrae TaxID=2571161 RepID=A0A4U1IBW8_9BURK|nr:hypothetical protein [Trinickia terrae]TKC91068.1 hypothetical protein FAZ69_06785 [Trinickia terrae]